MLPGLVDTDSIISNQWRIQISFYVHNVYESNNTWHESQIWSGASHKSLLGKRLKSYSCSSPFAKYQKVALLCLKNCCQKNTQQQKKKHVFERIPQYLILFANYILSLYVTKTEPTLKNKKISGGITTSVSQFTLLRPVGRIGWESYRKEQKRKKW